MATINFGLFISKIYLVFLFFIIKDKPVVVMDCIKIKSLKEIEDFLRYHKREIQDFNYQLSTNKAFIYKISTGEIVLIPGELRDEYECLVFSDTTCFNEALLKESFPVDNYNKNILEYDQKGVLQINRNIENYHQYLNRRLNLSYAEIDHGNIDEYYKNIMKLKKRNPQDMIALGVILGEIRRKELNGEWILMKRYGTYNPYYIPLIVYDKDKLLPVYDILMNMASSRLSSSKFFFKSIRQSSKKAYESSGYHFIELD